MGKILTILDLSSADYWDVRYDSTKFINIQKDLAKERFSSSDFSGIHVRVFKKGEWRSAAISQQDPNLDIIRKISTFTPKTNGGPNLQTLQPWKYDKDELGKKNPEDVSLEEKISLVRNSYSLLKQYDARIVSAFVSYWEVIVEKLFINSEGSRLRFKAPVFRLGLGAYARENGNVQGDYDRLAAFGLGFEFLDQLELEKLCRSLASGAIELLQAEKPPSGKVPVVLDPDNAGTLAHESFGHGLEADQVLRGRSYLKDLLRKPVASEYVTIVDNPAYPNVYGSYPFDDEGIRSRKTVLVEKGILKSFLHTRETASHLGVDPTGNGRAESFAKKVFVRMSNTYFEMGDWQLDEMVEDIDYGVYLVKLRTGMEDPLGGSLQMTSHKAYLIEKGEKTKLLRSVTVSGSALDLLRNVDAVGREFALGPGHCGKGFEDIVRTTTGGGPVRVKEAVIGGG